MSDSSPDSLTALGWFAGAPDLAAWSDLEASALVLTDDPALRTTADGRFGVVRSDGLWCVNERVDGWWEHRYDTDRLQLALAFIASQPPLDGA